MNVHQVLSVGGGAPVQDHFRPAREHDSRPRTVDASWRGYGLRADVASARLARLRAGDVHGVRGVIRRHEHWQPKVDDVARGQVAQACCPGTDLDARLEQETRCLDGRVMDAEVPVSRGPHARPRRLVGVHTPPGDGCFLTHRPPRIGPRQVADRSRVRWAVARSIRLDTAVNRLDALDPAPPCSWKTRVPASLIASTIAALRAPTHHGHTRPQQVGAPRTEAPLHPRRLAWPLAIAWPSRAQAFELQGAEALRRWDKSAAWLTHSGRDPNGRRRPAV